MDELRFNGTGPDASYLANSTVFFSALFTSSIFRNAWPAEKLGSQELLENEIGWFKQMFEGGLTGNRIHIAARKTARQDLNDRIRKILSFVGVMADESDIAILLQTGVVTRKSRKKTRKAAKAVVASQQ